MRPPGKVKVMPVVMGMVGSTLNLVGFPLVCSGRQLTELPWLTLCVRLSKLVFFTNTVQET